MPERLGVKSAWEDAAQVAGKAHHEFIQKEHILAGICKNKCRPLEKLSKKFKVNLTELRDQIHEAVHETYPSGFDHPDGIVNRSPECKMVFNSAQELGNPISCLYLLAVMLKNPGKIIKDTLQRINVQPAALRKYYSSCTDLECKGEVYKPSWKESIYKTLQKHTPTFVDKLEAFTLKLPHILHAVVISIFILLFSTAEGYFVIKGIIEGKEISKMITHALIHTFLFSLIIYGGHIVYKRFIASSH